ncbi:unnamed protein product [Cuscuta epithymum]|uniref:Dof zinc finger protein n=1 Tax=Cuscuta epithymum TaxID=186058 RepID=A0AAV0EPT8_9ASTE|nr:unnamed protein product [Cuscuta epithymum]
MPSDASDQRRPAKLGAPPPPEPEHLRCPRCNSTNTKFCYYNNYNFSQPRHFCKACRRYWTHGGTLRDIPVGGGSRKNAKRSRTVPCSSPGSVITGAHSFSSGGAHEFRRIHATSAAPGPFLFPVQGIEQGPPMLNLCGSFTSLLNTHGPGGLLGLGGFGVGPGMEEVGYGIGRAMWPFPGVAEGGAAAVLGGGTWQQLGGGEIGGDTFGFPDLAISAQGNVMK